MAGDFVGRVQMAVTDGEGGGGGKCEGRRDNKLEERLMGTGFTSNGA
jgi:hypothetical protein